MSLSRLTDSCSTTLRSEESGVIQNSVEKQVMTLSPEEVRPNEIKGMGPREDDGVDQVIMGERAGRVCDKRTDK